MCISNNKILYKFYGIELLYFYFIQLMQTIDSKHLWSECLTSISRELGVEADFNMWIRPLQCSLEENQLNLFAPNRFVLEWVETHYQKLIKESVIKVFGNTDLKINYTVGSIKAPTPKAPLPAKKKIAVNKNPIHLKKQYNFDSFIVGPNNEMAYAAAKQVCENPGGVYNPLFIYGGAGLGKTHLMHAIANQIQMIAPDARICCVHSEKFVTSMVKALQNNTMDQFKSDYRDIDVLLFDDVQFIAQKPRSQVEFFHTFNSLLDAQGSQVVLTCDRYPKELEGFESRLISRFSGGLTVAIDPPDLETRVAILMSKADMSQVKLPQEVAFFIAKRIQSNVRELEGALKRVIASAHFTNNKTISLEFTRQALKDLLAVQSKSVKIDNIQKTVAKHYNIKLSDLMSTSRKRVLVRPRQMAMYISRTLTTKSLPEIAAEFARDHTTILHACQTIEELIKNDDNLREDYQLLSRILSN